MLEKKAKLGANLGAKRGVDVGKRELSFEIEKKTNRRRIKTCSRSL